MLEAYVCRSPNGRCEITLPLPADFDRTGVLCVARVEVKDRKSVAGYDQPATPEISLSAILVPTHMRPAPPAEASPSERDDAEIAAQFCRLYRAEALNHLAGSDGREGFATLARAFDEEMVHPDLARRLLVGRLSLSGLLFAVVDRLRESKEITPPGARSPVDLLGVATRLDEARKQIERATRDL